MSDCAITGSFVAAVSGHPAWWNDDRRYHCAYCGVRTCKWSACKGAEPPGDASSRDHVIPKKLGGRLLIPACVTCNRAKGSGSLETFMASAHFQSVRQSADSRHWSVEDLWLAHAAAALQICFRLKNTVVEAAVAVAA